MPYRRSGCSHQHERDAAGTEYPVSDAAQDPSSEASSAVGAHSDQVHTIGLGIPDNAYGHASSLAMYRNLLLIQFDQGADDDDLSKMIALDAATGEPAWQRNRPVANSWSSPIVVEHAGRAQLITAAGVDG